ncbi:MAG: GGDEF domain-containing protein, partial [Nitrospiraceae bacterium]
PVLDVRAVSERIRYAVESSPVKIEELSSAITVTISVGGTTFNPVSDHGGLDIAMAGADRNLYKAKQLGRNRVFA